MTNDRQDFLGRAAASETKHASDEKHPRSTTRSPKQRPTIDEISSGGRRTSPTVWAPSPNGERAQSVRKRAQAAKCLKLLRESKPNAIWALDILPFGLSAEELGCAGDPQEFSNLGLLRAGVHLHTVKTTVFLHCGAQTTWRMSADGRHHVFSSVLWCICR